MRALECAAFLAYRGANDMVQEALELLRINDHATLLKASTTLVRGPLTWARVAELVLTHVARALLDGGETRAIVATLQAADLGSRLATRDASPTARVTHKLRSRIEMVVRAGAAVRATVQLREGVVPTEDRVGKLVALKMRWYRLREEFGEGEMEESDVEWVRAIALGACGHVLSHPEAHSGGLKAMAARAAAAWAAEAEAGPPASKKAKVGEAVPWDDDF